MSRLFQVMLVVSLVGLAGCAACVRDWKTLALGLLFAAANILIFLT